MLKNSPEILDSSRRGHSDTKHKYKHIYQYQYQTSNISNIKHQTQKDNSKIIIKAHHPYTG